MTKDKNILFIEPLCREKEHLAFNSDLIQHIQQLHEISFCGGSQYARNLEDRVNEFQSEYTTAYNAPSGKELIKRYFFIWKTILKNIDKYSALLFSSFDNTFFSLFSILFYPIGGYRMKKKSNILLIHNNLHTLKNNRIKRYLLKTSIRLYHWKCIVLTEKMHSIFQQLMNSDAYFYPHPYYKVEYTADTTIDTVRLLLVGRQAEYAIKSSFLGDLISEINRITATGTNKRQVELHISSAMDIPQNNNFPIYTYPKLTHGEYSNLFNSASFILFPYNYSDTFRASGILMDAISFETPFVAPQDGHFEEYRGCGFLYTQNTFSDIIQKCLNVSDDEYRLMINNIRNKKAEIDNTKNKMFNYITEVNE